MGDRPSNLEVFLDFASDFWWLLLLLPAVAVPLGVSCGSDGGSHPDNVQLRLDACKTIEDPHERSQCIQSVK